MRRFYLRLGLLSAAIAVTACAPSLSDRRASPAASPSAFAVLNKLAPDDVSDLRRRAETGEARAQYLLALAYEYGRGVPQDIPSAISWYSKAAERGYCAAQLVLARKYFFGDDVTQDYAQAYRLFEPLARRGNLDAIQALQAMYRAGWGVKEDRTRARYWEDRWQEVVKRYAHYAEARSYLLDPESGCAPDVNVAPSTSPAGNDTFKLGAHDAWVVDMQFSEDGKQLYSASHQDEAIFVWDTATRTKRSEIVVPGDPLSIAAHGRRVLVRVPGKRAVAGSIIAGRFVQTSAPGERIRIDYFSRLEQVETVSGKFYRDSRTGKRLASTPPGPNGSPAGFAVSPDLKRIVYSDADASGALHVWDVANAREERRIAARYPVWIMAAAYSPDGRYIATSGNNLSDLGVRTLRNIRLWEVQSGHEVRGFLSADGFVAMATTLAFSPDGTWLAAAGTDFKHDYIYLFDLASGQELARFTPPNWHGGEFILLFSPDGKRLAVAKGGDISLYPLPAR